MSTMDDMPVLRAEDDGFLLQLRNRVLTRHLNTLDLEKCSTIDECVSKLLADSEASVDRGGSLPLYVPWRSDNGLIEGYTAVPVWAGEHVGIPLYGNIDPDGVESLITGNKIGAASLFSGFMAYSPAFRVALLVHHICQVVSIHPLAAEAFVLGRYEEMPFEDNHFREHGVPSTKLITVFPNEGLSTEWVANQDHSLVGVLRTYPRIRSWTIHIRSSQPKQQWMIDAWREICDSIDSPREAGYTSGGAKVVSIDAMPSGRTRKRTDNPSVSRMIAWIDSRLKASNFPVRGKMKDWQAAIIMFEKDNPDLAGIWSADAMRKAFERRRRRGY